MLSKSVKIEMPCAHNTVKRGQEVENEEKNSNGLQKRLK